jgi:hypothetical protein
VELVTAFKITGEEFGPRGDMLYGPASGEGLTWLTIHLGATTDRGRDPFAHTLRSPKEEIRHLITRCEEILTFYYEAPDICNDIDENKHQDPTKEKADNIIGHAVRQMRALRSRIAEFPANHLHSLALKTRILAEYNFRMVGRRCQPGGSLP